MIKTPVNHIRSAGGETYKTPIHQIDSSVYNFKYNLFVTLTLNIGGKELSDNPSNHINLMKAAEKAQAVLELSEILGSQGIDTSDAEEFLLDTRLAMKDKDYDRALRMAKLAETSLKIIAQKDRDNEIPQPKRRSPLKTNCSRRSDFAPPPELPSHFKKKEEEPNKEIPTQQEEPPTSEQEEPIQDENPEPPEPEAEIPISIEEPEPPEPEAEIPIPIEEQEPIEDPEPPPPEVEVEPEQFELPPPPSEEPQEERGQELPPPPVEKDEELPPAPDRDDEEIGSEGHQCSETPPIDDIDVDATVEIAQCSTKDSGLDDFIIDEKIGSGGFAEVFLAKDKIGKKFALKMPHPDKFHEMDEKNRAKFLEEAQNWQKLFSYKDAKKGIVGIYSYAIEPKPYIAMEYMDSGSLKSNMKNMDFDEKLFCIKKVLDTLYTVHHLGVIHRDIKPENILLNSLGQWKLADWGLSKTLLESQGTTTQAGTIKATIAYASPEQIESDEFGDVDWRTDIYQVGAMAYEMFTGVKPFEGEPAKILYAVVAKKPKHPCEVNEDIPQQLGDAIMTAIEKHKKDRWQDAVFFKKALEEDLNEVKKEESISVEETKQDQNIESYKELLTDGMVNGEISTEVERMLGRMRKTLGISEECHSELVNELKESLKPPICSKCNRETKYISEYDRHYCYYCQLYAPDPKKENQTSQNICNTCNQQLEYIHQYGQWYCYNCKEYFF